MTTDSIVECVPNFSEGLEERKVRSIVAAMRVEGVALLDFSRDPDHNRSVITVAGPPAAVVESAVRGAGRAAELIDLTRQSGVHPRIGAADVIPFVPVRGVSLADCAVLARQAGHLIWQRYGVPVYFYGAAATRPDRIQLEDLRRGQFEGLREAVLRDSARRPDLGGPELHPTAGASVVGARPFLIAYNLYLRPTAPQAAATRPAHNAKGHPEIGIARAIAREIRSSSGGMRGVKAIGVVANGRAQVSMNITDFHATPISAVHSMVELLAGRHNAEVAEAELIGLVPEAACQPDDRWTGLVAEFDPERKILERRLERPMEWPAEQEPMPGNDLAVHPPSKP